MRQGEDIQFDFFFKVLAVSRTVGRCEHSESEWC